MTRILHCLTFIFGVLLLSCPASAQPAAGGKVVFEVTDSLHTPLAYATIALKAHADGKMYAATTGLDGKCVFTLPADMYDAGITFVGYEPRHMSVAAVEARDQYIRCVFVSPPSLSRTSSSRPPNQRGSPAPR